MKKKLTNIVIPRCPCCNQIIKDSEAYKLIANRLARIDVTMQENKDNPQLLQSLWNEWNVLQELVDYSV